jgi:hypothetical protein
MEHIPITAGALATFAGALFIAVVAGLWVKRFLPDWRWTPLAVLVVTVGLVIGGTALARAAAGDALRGRDTALAAFWGLFAATLETFGYEAVVNALGLAGIGKRSDAALDKQAQARLLDGEGQRWR